MCWVLILSLWRSHDWRVPSAPHPHLLHPTKPHINEASILIGFLLPILIGLFLHILIRFSFPILIRFSADLWRGTSARPELICWIKIKLSKSSQFLSLSHLFPMASIFLNDPFSQQLELFFKYKFHNFLSNKLWKIFLQCLWSSNALCRLSEWRLSQQFRPQHHISNQHNTNKLCLCWFGWFLVYHI